MRIQRKNWVKDTGEGADSHTFVHTEDTSSRFPICDMLSCLVETYLQLANALQL